jgi:DNA-binding GntR family transcriptional regulator
MTTPTQALSSISVQRRPPLASIVAERIRDAIMYGELALGEAVSEEKLAARLGVSRTPVREALNALQLQGLVTIQPQRGSNVFSPSDQDLRDICDYRALIEIHAMRRAMHERRRETVALLNEADDQMLAADANGNATLAAKADAAFHDAFIQHGGNGLLSQGYLLVSGKVGAIRFFARQSSGTRRYANSEHRDIIAAFETGDLMRTETILSLHIANMRTHFLEALAATAAA